MTVNAYTKKWCDEDYDVRKEDFYVENAYCVAKKEWAISGIKHGIFAFFIAAMTILMGSLEGVGERIPDALINMGILTACYWFYGIRNFNANCLGSGLFMYISMAIILFTNKGQLSGAPQIILAILSFAAWIYLTFVQPSQYFKMSKRMKKKEREKEQEEAKASADSYEKWKESYKAFRYGLPEPEKPLANEDPVMKKAKELFEGYQESQQMLKTRYRQLAKQYHPDKGGDTRLFQCIIQIYEETSKKF